MSVCMCVYGCVCSFISIQYYAKVFSHLKLLQISTNC